MKYRINLPYVKTLSGRFPLVTVLEPYACAVVWSINVARGKGKLGVGVLVSLLFQSGIKQNFPRGQKIMKDEDQNRGTSY